MFKKKLIFAFVVWNIFFIFLRGFLYQKYNKVSDSIVAGFDCRGLELQTSVFDIVSLESTEDISSRNKIGMGVAIFSGYFISNKHVFDTGTNFLVYNYLGESYQIENIWFHPSADIALGKLQNFPHHNKLCLESDLSSIKNIYFIDPDFRISSGEFLGVNNGEFFTDFKLQKGYSGGPVISLSGSLIGLNSSTYYDGKSVGIVFDHILIQEIIKKYSLTGVVF